MQAKVRRSKIHGIIRAPQSKSFGIRLILYSLLSKVKLKEINPSEDIKVAINVVKSLGVKQKGNEFLREGSLITPSSLYFGGSATTLRMTIPILSVLGGKILLDGDESLRKRPINAVIEALKDQVRFSSTSLPTYMEGKLKSDKIAIRGNESSQYISGFMYAFSISGGGEIELIPPVSSKSYIYITADLLNSLGGDIRIQGNKIIVNEGKFREYEGEIPGDYALASFYAIASIITDDEKGVIIQNLYNPPSYEGDHSIVKILEEMGAYSKVEGNSWVVKNRGKLRGIKVNIDDMPDLAPSIASISPFAESDTVIEGISRLKTKESNRIETISTTLRSFAVNVEVFNDEKMIIYPSMPKYGKIVCPNDHRIAMMAGVLSLYSGGEIEKAECVNKSNPYFWKDLISLGGDIRLV